MASVRRPTTLWRSKFGGMSVPDAKRFKDLEAENTRLKKLLAEQVFQNDLIRAMRCKKTMVSAPARRTLVREWIEGGASERCALAAIGMSASALRYRPGEDRNVELREHSVALAHRHRRYGVGMISLSCGRKVAS